MQFGGVMKNIWRAWDIAAVFVTLALATHAYGGAFTYDPKTGSCKNAAGAAGYNVGEVGPCADFKGQTIEKVDYSKLDLRGANFLKSKLKNVKFTGALLTNAVFRQARLTSIQFDNANLEQADFRDSLGWAGRFWHVQARGANFSGANLRSANFLQSILDGALFRSTGRENADFSGATLHMVDFNSAKLQGAQLSFTDVFGASWWNAEFDEWTQLPFSVQRAKMEGMVYRGW